MRMNNSLLLLSMIMVLDVLPNVAAQHAGLEKLWGKAIMIQGGDDTFWEVNADTGRVFGNPGEPAELQSSFFAVQGPGSSSFYLRLANFDYMCFDANKMVLIPAEDIESKAFEINNCEMEVQKDDTRTAGNPDEDNAVRVFLKSVKTGFFVDDNKASIQLNPSPAAKFSYTIRDEKDIIVDLGALEQYTRPENDASVTFKASETQFLAMRQSQPHTVVPITTKASSARFTVRRLSRFNNFISIQNVNNDRFVCRRDNVLNSFPTFLPDACTFRAVHAGANKILLAHADTEFFVRTNGSNALTVTGLGTLESTPLTLELGEAIGPNFEVVDIKFDTLSANVLPFVPSEVKTIKFSNDSPVDQEQQVTFSTTDTVTSETSFSVAVGVETSFETEFKFFGNSAAFGITLSVDTEFGRVSTKENEVSIEYSKTFTVAACTEMGISIATAAPQANTIPFIATMRRTNIDGSSTLLEATGSQTGIVSDQTQVEVISTPIAGCVPAADASHRRQLLRGGGAKL